MCALRSCTLRLVQVEAVFCVWSVNMCMLYTDPFYQQYFLYDPCCFDGFLSGCIFLGQSLMLGAMRYWEDDLGNLTFGEDWRYCCIEVNVLAGWHGYIADGEKGMGWCFLRFASCLNWVDWHVLLKQLVCGIPTQVPSLWRRSCTSMLPLGRIFLGGFIAKKCSISVCKL